MSSADITPFHPALIYLIRHGQTQLNVSGLIRGHLDEPLDETGQRQAEELGWLFQGVTIARVIASSLQRALRIGKPIAAAGGIEVEIDPGLNDRDYGEWVSRPRDEVEQRFGSMNAASGVEPWETLTARVLAAFEAIVANERNRDVSTRQRLAKWNGAGALALVYNQAPGVSFSRTVCAGANQTGGSKKRRVRQPPCERRQ